MMKSIRFLKSIWEESICTCWGLKQREQDPFMMTVDCSRRAQSGTMKY